MAIDLTLDFHAHILPGCDHGSDGIKTSLGQLSMAREAGIRTVCATSHFYPHKESLRSFLARRDKCWQKLKAQLSPASPGIRLGAEVLICEGLENLDGIGQLALQDTHEILIEMPFYSWSTPILDTLYELKDRRDLRVIMAHADRYPEEDIEDLIGDGFLMQLNAEALLKPFKRKTYLDWIAEGSVRYLGSDIHQLGRQYRDYEKAAGIIRKHNLG